jgi:predicted DNA-binding transcriptional regulator AlpA
MSEMTGADLGITSVKGRLLTVKEVAGFCKISERTVEIRIKKKRFPFGWFPFGAKTFRADSKDVDAWLDSMKTSEGIDYPLPKRAIEKIRKEEVTT